PFPLLREGLRIRGQRCEADRHQPEAAPTAAAELVGDAGSGEQQSLRVAAHRFSAFEDPLEACTRAGRSHAVLEQPLRCGLPGGPLQADVVANRAVGAAGRALGPERADTEEPFLS